MSLLVECQFQEARRCGSRSPGHVVVLAQAMGKPSLSFVRVGVQVHEGSIDSLSTFNPLQLRKQQAHYCQHIEDIPAGAGHSHDLLLLRSLFLSYDPADFKLPATPFFKQPYDNFAINPYGDQDCQCN